MRKQKRLQIQLKADSSSYFWGIIKYYNSNESSSSTRKILEALRYYWGTLANLEEDFEKQILSILENIYFLQGKIDEIASTFNVSSLPETKIIPIKYQEFYPETDEASLSLKIYRESFYELNTINYLKNKQDSDFLVLKANLGYWGAWADLNLSALPDDLKQASAKNSIYRITQQIHYLEEIIEEKRWFSTQHKSSPLHKEEAPNSFLNDDCPNRDKFKLNWFN